MPRGHDSSAHAEATAARPRPYFSGPNNDGSNIVFRISPRSLVTAVGGAGGLRTSAQANPAMNDVDRALMHSRVRIRLKEPNQPTLALQAQFKSPATEAASELGDVIYVHGGTFGADLSIFFRFDGRSWADDINETGLSVWGFDFAGYGASDRYSPGGTRPAGRMDDVLPQLHRVVEAVRARNGNRPVALVGHSWGASVAARYAGMYPEDVRALVLFAPIVPRAAAVTPAAGTPLPSHFPLTLLAQYRRFIEDVPRGQPQVLGEAHFLTWGAAFLATHADVARRTPPSVNTPSGPVADIGALWSGHALYEPSLVHAPALLVRGEWDSLCTGADAKRLLAGLGSADKSNVTIERGTHLMHLESQRCELHRTVSMFLERLMK